MEIIKWATENEVEVCSGVLNKFVLLVATHGDVPVSEKTSQDNNIKDYQF